LLVETDLNAQLLFINALEILVPHMEAAPGPSEAPSKNSVRNEKDRARRQAGGARHQHAILEKDAEIAHLTSNLTQMVEQMQTLTGVAALVSDYQPEVYCALG
jgi:hypothetical protein